MDLPKKIGKYEVRRKIGRGAMGIVYEAYDTVIERRVAIKTLRVDLFEPAQLPDLRARFKREAQSAGQLSHPHIVTIFDYGEHEGAPFIAMEYMVGEELSSHISRGIRLPTSEIVRLMTQLLGALSYAHEHKVVHRDVKPANVFILQDGSLKVVDFGIAHVEASNLTDTGAILGTPAYMSPEQFLALPVDERSDVFSAGVILYELLTGEKPFTGSLTTIMQKVLRQDPLEPSTINPLISVAWDRIVSRALAKKPEQRFQTSRQFLETLKLLGVKGALGDSAESGEPKSAIPSEVRPEPAPLHRPLQQQTLQKKAGAISPVRMAGIAFAIVAALAVGLSIYSLFRPAPFVSGGAPLDIEAIERVADEEEKRILANQALADAKESAAKSAAKEIEAQAHASAAKAAIEEAAAEKAVAEKAAAEKVAAQKASAETAIAQRLAAEKAQILAAESAAREAKIAADKAAAQKLEAERLRQEAIAEERAKREAEERKKRVAATSAKSAAPIVHSPLRVVEDMLTVAQVGPSDFVVDLGSGDGRIVLTAASKYGARGLGVEIDGSLVNLSRSAAIRDGLSDRVSFVQQDLFSADISKATVVTLYLLPNALNELAPRLLEQLRPGTRVVTHDYPITGWKPAKYLNYDVEEKRSISGVTTTLVYLYVIPRK